MLKRIEAYINRDGSIANRLLVILIVACRIFKYRKEFWELTKRLHLWNVGHPMVPSEEEYETMCTHPMVVKDWKDLMDKVYKIGPV